MRDNPATDALGGAFGICALLNLIRTTTSLDGWMWFTVRVVASVVFCAAAIWWLIEAARHFYRERSD
jgi:hypothetical protein